MAGAGNDIANHADFLWRRNIPGVLIDERVDVRHADRDLRRGTGAIHTGVRDGERRGFGRIRCADTR